MLRVTSAHVSCWCTLIAICYPDNRDRSFVDWKDVWIFRNEAITFGSFSFATFELEIVHAYWDLGTLPWTIHKSISMVHVAGKHITLIQHREFSVCKPMHMKEHIPEFLKGRPILPKYLLRTKLITSSSRDSKIMGNQLQSTQYYTLIDWLGISYWEHQQSKQNITIETRFTQRLARCLFCCFFCKNRNTEKHPIPRNSILHYTWMILAVSHLKHEFSIKETIGSSR